MDTRELLAIAKARRFAATGEGKAIREAARISVREIADAAGTAPTTIWRWENGHRQPRGSAAGRWADVLTACAADLPAAAS